MDHSNVLYQDVGCQVMICYECLSALLVGVLLLMIYPQ